MEARSRWLRPKHILLALIALGLVLRVVAALIVEMAARSQGRLCLFDDTNIYWQLGRAIRVGEPYVVSQYGIPHYALRTPGYPLFLALGQVCFGESTLAIRLAQAVLGAVCVWLVTGLMRQITRGQSSQSAIVPLIAASLMSVEPHSVFTSVLLLSEALFVPLMLVSLWGLALFWSPGKAASSGKPRRSFRPLLAVGTGLALGGTILVRPSWALFVPSVLGFWWLISGEGRRVVTAKTAVVVALGVALVMAPWWYRNAKVFGRFVPTALWVGASLYDGLNPQADGSSDMKFLEEPEIRTLDEVTQDRVLRDRAIEFAEDHPGRVLQLAVIKAGRFWSPWPNADQFWSPAVAVVSALFVLPLYVLIAIGLFRHKGDGRAWLLLAGPLLYFALLHIVFVSSIRYRIPAIVPAFGLAAFGLAERRRVSEKERWVSRR